MSTIGIDLGTTNSVAAYVDQSANVQLIKSESGNYLTPSVIAFLNGHVYVGVKAKKYQSEGSENIANFFKRSMGDRYYSMESDGNDYTAVDLSAIVLKKIKADAERELNKPVTKAVITVPAYFSNAQREATIQAGQKAGLEVLGIINEPTAAAIAYGYRPGLENKHVLVFDLGGGTFDVTISKVEQNEINVLSTEGDYKLGGKDFDDILMEYFASQFEREFGIDLLNNIGTTNYMGVYAEIAKKQLTKEPVASVTISEQGYTGTYSITREHFAMLSERLLERAWALVKLALENSKLTMDDLDDIILVGGSTRMPMVAEYIEKRTSMKPLCNLNPDEVVAMGAAIQANILAAEQEVSRYALAPSKKVNDVMSHSLGMIAVNEDYSAYVNQIMIAKNVKIPATNSELYSIATNKSGDNKIEIYVTQGESSDPKNCDVIGKYTVHNVPFTVKQPTYVDVLFAYDANGVVQIKAREVSTKENLPIKVSKSIGSMRWLNETPAQPKQASKVNVMIVIDTSYSMSEGRIGKAIKAAQSAVTRFANGNFAVGLMAFANESKVLHAPSENLNNVKNMIGNLEDYVEEGLLGYQTDAEPLQYLNAYWGDSTDKNIVLLLTDGLWGKEIQETKVAKELHAKGIDVCAIGIGHANERFLKQIATLEDDGVFTTEGNLVETFTTIAQIVSDRYSLASSKR